MNGPQQILFRDVSFLHKSHFDPGLFVGAVCQILADLLQAIHDYDATNGSIRYPCLSL